MSDISIEKRYVFRWMAFFLRIGSLIPIALAFFLSAYTESRAFLALLGAEIAIVLLLVGVMFKAYRGGIKQAIHLHPHKMVFEYISGAQTFEFRSTAEWELGEESPNWVIKSRKDGSSKKIPKAAFPSFKRDVESFYRLAT